MRNKYTIYGSCQADALAYILNSNSYFNSKYEYCTINRAYIMTEDEVEILNQTLFPQLVLFIFQPIINFPTKMTTEYIIHNVLKKDCIKIAFPYLHFSGYHPQTTIAKFNGPFDGFCPYHDINLIKEYNLTNGNVDIPEFIKRISQTDFYNEKFLLQNIENNLYELSKREHEDINYHYIKVCDFIRRNYKNMLLFWTINHPTKYMLQYVMQGICGHLQINISFDDTIDFLKKDNILPIYNSVAKLLDLRFANSMEQGLFEQIYSLDIVFKKDIEIYNNLCKTENNFEPLKF